MTQPSQLCALAVDWRGDLPKGGAMCEEKRDGWRALYIRDWEGVPRLYTRNGHRIEGAGHILHRLGQMEEAAGERMFFDMELVVDGTLAATKRWVESGWKAGTEAGQAYLFDALPLAEWRAGGSPTPLLTRKERLMDLASRAVDDWTWRPGSRGRDDKLPPVVVLPHAWVFDRRDVLEQAERVWAADGEGVMLKDPDSPYRRNRDKAWQKVKRENQHKWQLKAA